jgi:DNA polymerase (family 10)
MDNYSIAEQLSLLSKLMDIHGENSFKSKSYANAAFAIEKLPQEIATLSTEKIFAIKGIGESVGSKIAELLEHGELHILKGYLVKTPSGVLEMMNIKGLGPKKIHTLWKELQIDSIEKLKRICLNNQLAEKKGFGEKTQQKILEEINFQELNVGKYLYAQAEAFAEAMQNRLQEHFSKFHMQLTGAYRRQAEIIDQLEWVTTVPQNELKKYLVHQEVELVSETADELTFTAENTLQLHFYIAEEPSFFKKLFETSSSEEFLKTLNNLIKNAGNEKYESEEEIFQKTGLHYIPPFLREHSAVIEKAKKEPVGKVIQINEIKGLIHAHSNWSDGAYTIEQMAVELIHLGFEYLVISDHSKAAYYAGGLTEQRIKEQHRYIDELNKKLAPFRIFKSIECDILNDGSMDYADKILSTFDLVIASVHSNLQMDEEKAMMRLMGAVTNPYVTILGHLTGRLLLKRKGYPVDYKAIIDACAQHKKVIEINASPVRLDMDWRWIEYALEKGVMLSINPDAHTIEEFHSIKYGVLVAQKGGLTKEHNLSSFSRDELEKFLQKRLAAKGLK